MFVKKETIPEQQNKRQWIQYRHQIPISMISLNEQTKIRNRYITLFMVCHGSDISFSGDAFQTVQSVSFLMMILWPNGHWTIAKRIQTNTYIRINTNGGLDSR